MNSVKEIITYFEQISSEGHAKGLAHFGINADKAYGIKVPVIRALAKDIGKNHNLALALWETEIHEARLLATMIDDWKLVTTAQMDAWVNDFNSWDICDQACGNLFDRTPYAQDKIIEWAEREEEYVRRAAFALIAYRTVHMKKEPDAEFEGYLPLIEKHAVDGRNFVKKAVNWALRQIGKRNLALHAKALPVAKRLATSQDPAARWVGKDAVRELTDEKQLARLRKKEKP